MECSNSTEESVHVPLRSGTTDKDLKEQDWTRGKYGATLAGIQMHFMQVIGRANSNPKYCKSWKKGSGATYKKNRLLKELRHRR